MAYFSRPTSGRRVFDLSVTLLVFGLIWGCSSQGDPFSQDVSPVMSITSVVPPDGATQVSPDTVLSIAFPLDLDPRTVTKDTVHLLDYTQADADSSASKDKKGRVVSTKITYASDKRLITILPDAALSESGRYQILVQDVRSTGNVTFSTLVSTFYTGRSSKVAPQVLSIRPLTGQVQVLATAPIQITFSKVMDRSSVLSALSVGPGIVGTATFQDSDRTVMTFKPGNLLAPGRTIYVTLRQDAKDTAGICMDRSFSSVFTIEPAPYVIPEFTVPSNYSTSVSRTTSVSVVFSTTMTTDTVADAFNLVYGSTFLGRSDGRFTFSTVGSPPRTQAVYQSTNSLPASTSIQIRVNGLAQSTRGVGLSPLFFSTFVTAQ